VNQYRFVIEQRSDLFHQRRSQSEIPYFGVAGHIRQTKTHRRIRETQFFQCEML
jgi:hypothetical protein